MGLGLGLRLGIGVQARLWMPSDLDGYAWDLDPDREVEIVSGKIASWGDVSGGGHPATQTTPESRGTLVLDGLNGHATVALASGQFFAHTLSLAPPCTLAFVAKTSVAAGSNYACVYTGGGLFAFATGFGVNNWGAYANANVDSGATLAAFKLCIIVARAYNDMDLRTNGSKVTRATGVSAYNPGSFIGQGGGGAQYLTGEVARMIACTGALSDSGCESLEAHLLAKYALL